MKKLGFRAVSNILRITQLARKMASSSPGNLSQKHKCFPILNLGQDKELWVQIQKMQVSILASLLTDYVNLITLCLNFIVSKMELLKPVLANWQSHLNKIMAMAVMITCKILCKCYINVLLLKRKKQSIYILLAIRANSRQNCEMGNIIFRQLHYSFYECFSFLKHFSFCFVITMMQSSLHWYSFFLLPSKLTDFMPFPLC